MAEQAAHPPGRYATGGPHIVDGSGKHTTRAEHPLVAVITHWIHVVALVLLVFTGFEIHSPFVGGSLATNRFVHLTAAFVLVATGIVRVYWAFLGTGSANVGTTEKIRDCRFFCPDPINRAKTLQMVKYYLFMRRTHPRTAKYNPLQKAAYIALIVAILVQLNTGLMLWTPTAEFFAPVTYALGGPLYVRAIHYLAMWVFIIITAIHVYLTLAEATWEIPLIFAWRERPIAERELEETPRPSGGAST